MDLYHYVGLPEIAERAAGQPHGTPIRSPADVTRWVKQSDQPHGIVIVTFVIDSEGELRIADRHSEHVACAGGRAVRSAGEMTFDVRATTTVVIVVSNQSTGTVRNRSRGRRWRWPSDELGSTRRWALIRPVCSACV